MSVTMPNDPFARLRETLDACESWPCNFVFKFIAPAGESGRAVGELLRGFEVTTRASANGRYISFTAEIEMATSEEVVAVYRAAAAIPGVITL